MTQKYPSREIARDLISRYLTAEHLLKHSRETEVIMRALAKHFGEEPDYWGVTGLLHDLDMEVVNGDYTKHGKKTCEILQQNGVENEEMFTAIQAHTEMLGHLGVRRQTRFDYCLAAAENVTGLITAYALMRPEKMDGMSASGLNKRFKSRAFAANVNRECIQDIEKTGLTKNEFFELSIKAMQEIAGETGF